MDSHIDNIIHSNELYRTLTDLTTKTYEPNMMNDDVASNSSSTDTPVLITLFSPIFPHIDQFNNNILENYTQNCYSSPTGYFSSYYTYPLKYYQDTIHDETYINVYLHYAHHLLYVLSATTTLAQQLVLTDSNQNIDFDHELHSYHYLRYYGYFLKDHITTLNSNVSTNTTILSPSPDNPQLIPSPKYTPLTTLAEYAHYHKISQLTLHNHQNSSTSHPSPNSFYSHASRRNALLLCTFLLQHFDFLIVCDHLARYFNLENLSTSSKSSNFHQSAQPRSEHHLSAYVLHCLEHIIFQNTQNTLNISNNDQENILMPTMTDTSPLTHQSPHTFYQDLLSATTLTNNTTLLLHQITNTMSFLNQFIISALFSHIASILSTNLVITDVFYSHLAESHNLTKMDYLYQHDLMFSNIYYTPTQLNLLSLVINSNETKPIINSLINRSKDDKIQTFQVFMLMTNLPSFLHQLYAIYPLSLTSTHISTANEIIFPSAELEYRCFKFMINQLLYHFIPYVFYMTSENEHYTEITRSDAYFTSFRQQIMLFCDYFASLILQPHLHHPSHRSSIQYHYSQYRDFLVFIFNMSKLFENFAFSTIFTTTMNPLNQIIKPSSLGTNTIVNTYSHELITVLESLFVLHSPGSKITNFLNIEHIMAVFSVFCKDIIHSIICNPNFNSTIIESSQRNRFIAYTLIHYFTIYSQNVSFIYFPQYFLQHEVKCPITIKLSSNSPERSQACNFCPRCHQLSSSDEQIVSLELVIAPQSVSTKNEFVPMFYTYSIVNISPENIENNTIINSFLNMGHIRDFDIIFIHVINLHQIASRLNGTLPPSNNSNTSPNNLFESSLNYTIAHQPISIPQLHAQQYLKYLQLFEITDPKHLSFLLNHIDLYEEFSEYNITRRNNHSDFPHMYSESTFLSLLESYYLQNSAKFHLQYTSQHKDHLMSFINRLKVSKYSHHTNACHNKRDNGDNNEFFDNDLGIDLYREDITRFSSYNKTLAPNNQRNSKRKNKQAQNDNLQSDFRYYYEFLDIFDGFSPIYPPPLINTFESNNISSKYQHPLESILLTQHEYHNIVNYSTFLSFYRNERIKNDFVQLATVYSKILSVCGENDYLKYFLQNIHSPSQISPNVVTDALIFPHEYDSDAIPDLEMLDKANTILNTEDKYVDSKTLTINPDSKGIEPSVLPCIGIRTPNSCKSVLFSSSHATSHVLTYDIINNVIHFINTPRDQKCCYHPIKSPNEHHFSVFTELLGYFLRKYSNMSSISQQHKQMFIFIIQYFIDMIFTVGSPNGVFDIMDQTIVFFSQNFVNKIKSPPKQQQEQHEHNFPLFLLFVLTSIYIEWYHKEISNHDMNGMNLSHTTIMSKISEIGKYFALQTKSHASAQTTLNNFFSKQVGTLISELLPHGKNQDSHRQVSACQTSLLHHPYKQLSSFLSCPESTDTIYQIFRQYYDEHHKNYLKNDDCNSSNTNITFFELLPWLLDDFRSISLYSNGEIIHVPLHKHRLYYNINQSSIKQDSNFCHGQTNTNSVLIKNANVKCNIQDDITTTLYQIKQFSLKDVIFQWDIMNLYRSNNREDTTQFAKKNFLKQIFHNNYKTVQINTLYNYYINLSVTNDLLDNIITNTDSQQKIVDNSTSYNVIWFFEFSTMMSIMMHSMYHYLQQSFSQLLRNYTTLRISQQTNYEKSVASAKKLDIFQKSSQAQDLSVNYNDKSGSVIYDNYMNLELFKMFYSNFINAYISQYSSTIFSHIHLTKILTLYVKSTLFPSNISLKLPTTVENNLSNSYIGSNNVPSSTYNVRMLSPITLYYLIDTYINQILPELDRNDKKLRTSEFDLNIGDNLVLLMLLLLTLFPTYNNMILLQYRSILNAIHSVNNSSNQHLNISSTHIIKSEKGDIGDKNYAVEHLYYNMMHIPHNLQNIPRFDEKLDFYNASQRQRKLLQQKSLKTNNTDDSDNETVYSQLSTLIPQPNYVAMPLLKTLNLIMNNVPKYNDTHRSSSDLDQYEHICSLQNNNMLLPSLKVLQNNVCPNMYQLYEQYIDHFSPKNTQHVNDDVSFLDDLLESLIKGNANVLSSALNKNDPFVEKIYYHLRNKLIKSIKSLYMVYNETSINSENDNVAIFFQNISFFGKNPQTQRCTPTSLKFASFYTWISQYNLYYNRYLIDIHSDKTNKTKHEFLYKNADFMMKYYLFEKGYNIHKTQINLYNIFNNYSEMHQISKNTLVRGKNLTSQIHIELLHQFLLMLLYYDEKTFMSPNNKDEMNPFALFLPTFFPQPSLSLAHHGNLHMLIILYIIALLYATNDLNQMISHNSPLLQTHIHKLATLLDLLFQIATVLFVEINHTVASKLSYDDNFLPIFFPTQQKQCHLDEIDQVHEDQFDNSNIINIQIRLVLYYILGPDALKPLIIQVFKETFSFSAKSINFFLKCDKHQMKKQFIALFSIVTTYCINPYLNNDLFTNDPAYKVIVDRFNNILALFVYSTIDYTPQHHTLLSLEYQQNNEGNQLPINCYNQDYIPLFQLPFLSTLSIQRYINTLFHTHDINRCNGRDISDYDQNNALKLLSLPTTLYIDSYYNSKHRNICDIFQAQIWNTSANYIKQTYLFTNYHKSATFLDDFLIKCLFFSTQTLISKNQTHQSQIYKNIYITVELYEMMLISLINSNIIHPEYVKDRITTPTAQRIYVLPTVVHNQQHQPITADNNKSTDFVTLSQLYNNIITMNIQKELKKSNISRKESIIGAINLPVINTNVINKTIKYPMVYHRLRIFIDILLIIWFELFSGNIRPQADLIASKQQLNTEHSTLMEIHMLSIPRDQFAEILISKIELTIAFFIEFLMISIDISPISQKKGKFAKEKEKRQTTAVNSYFPFNSLAFSTTNHTTQQSQQSRLFSKFVSPHLTNQNLSNSNSTQTNDSSSTQTLDLSVNIILPRLTFIDMVSFFLEKSLFTLSNTSITLASTIYPYISFLYQRSIRHIKVNRKVQFNIEANDQKFINSQDSIHIQNYNPSKSDHKETLETTHKFANITDFKDFYGIAIQSQVSTHISLVPQKVIPPHHSKSKSKQDNNHDENDHSDYLCEDKGHVKVKLIKRDQKARSVAKRQKYCSPPPPQQQESVINDADNSNFSLKKTTKMRKVTPRVVNIGLHAVNSPVQNYNSPIQKANDINNMNKTPIVVQKVQSAYNNKQWCASDDSDISDDFSESTDSDDFTDHSNASDAFYTEPESEYDGSHYIHHDNDICVNDDDGANSVIHSVTSSFSQMELSSNACSKTSSSKQQFAQRQEFDNIEFYHAETGSMSLTNSNITEEDENNNYQSKRSQVVSTIESLTNTDMSEISSNYQKQQQISFMNKNLSKKMKITSSESDYGSNSDSDEFSEGGDRMSFVNKQSIQKTSQTPQIMKKHSFTNHISITTSKSRIRRKSDRMEHKNNDHKHDSYTQLSTDDPLRDFIVYDE